jgi:hypothetical protein
MFEIFARIVKSIATVAVLITNIWMWATDLFQQLVEWCARMVADIFAWVIITGVESVAPEDFFKGGGMLFSGYKAVAQGLNVVAVFMPIEEVTFILMTGFTTILTLRLVRWTMSCIPMLNTG